MKKKLSLLLAILTVFSVLTVFASCGETAQTVTTTKVAATTTAAEPEETVDPNSVDDLPELDYGGTVINVISCDRDWWKDEIAITDTNGEVINDAVFNRNKRVEQRLNVTINNTVLSYDGTNTTVGNAVGKAYTSGDDLYDIAFINCFVAASRVTSGYFKDLTEIENINLSKDYWLQSLNESLSFHDHQYIASGDISLSHIRMAFVTLFNKQLFDKYKVPYLYEAVESGDWTLEYQIQLVNTFYEDNDGSTTQTDDDTYGLIASAKIMADPYWESNEISILSKDDNGDYIFAIDEEKFSNAVDLLISLFSQTGTHKYKHETGDGELMTMSQDYAQGKGAMMTTILVECEREWMRNATDEYGVVPMPKYNKDQEEYHTHLFDQYTVVAICSTVPNDENSMMGAFLEAMAYQSSVDTIPAYYETTLKMKYSSDPTSWEMLDRVMNNVVVDAGNVYYSQLNGPHAKMGQIVDSGTNTVSSTMKTFKKATEVCIERLNTSLSKLLE